MYYGFMPTCAMDGCQHGYHKLPAEKKPVLHRQPWKASTSTFHPLLQGHPVIPRHLATYHRVPAQVQVLLYSCSVFWPPMTRLPPSSRFSEPGSTVTDTISIEQFTQLQSCFIEHTVTELR